MPSEPTDRYPLASLQRGMLFHALAAPESTLYVEQYRYTLDGDLDPAAFRAAWEAACARHPVLRTGFDAESAGRPVQLVWPAVELPLVVADWRARPAPGQVQQLRQLGPAERERGFDLSRAPLFRLRLVRLADRRWQLLWTYHHLILDGWSAGLVLDDVAAAYRAARQGEPTTLPPAPPYRDFVAWAGDQDLAGAREHWTGVLAGFTEPTPLGIARTDDPGVVAGERIGRRLPGELAERLDRYGRDHQLTLETLLAGAWAVVLGRYASAEDVVFGVTWSGRSGQLPGLDRMAGLLIDTGPVRVRLDPDQQVDRWLAGLQREQARARKFGPVPLDRLPAWSEVPAGRRLFDSIMVVEDFPADPMRQQWLDGVRISDPVSVQQTNFPLTLLAFPHGREAPGLVVEALFDAAALDPRLVEALLGHLETVLDGLVRTPRLGEVELLPPAERAELTRRGAPRAPFPPVRGGLAPDRFAAWAQREPDRVAVAYQNQQVSYQELRARVARLAHRLRRLGVGPGELVGICLPRGVGLVVAVLAVACAGGGYVPVDRRYPAARVRTVLSDASVAVLVTDRELARVLGPDVPAMVCLDDPAEQEVLGSLPQRLPKPAAGPHDLAYVIYTSGSTGTPKGVAVEHAQLARLFDATRDWFQFGPDDVWALFHSIAFDFSVWELWGALASGGRLVVVPDDLTRDPAGFRQLLLTEGVTVLNQTPSSFRALQHADLAQTPAAYRLRWVILGGEMLEVTSLRPWLDRYGDQRPRLVNMYGITETTVHVTYRPISHSDLATGVPSPIGEPIPDLAVRLVDPRGRLVPVGVPGEIQVGGAGVARGYLHRPELTADRFTADGTQRWYRTGDRARWLPAGGLEFLGRLDDQVKIRGHRIELGEIESVLRDHPQLSEVVVVARATGTDGHQQLVAYVVPEPDGPQLSWPEVRSWLALRVPDHLVPAGLISLDRLPLTPNGKLDRAALPELGPARPAADTPVAPRTDTERILAEVWSEVLGLEQVGTADNFFALGGDSILTIQVVSRAGRRGVSITPAQLFAHQSIAELAQVAVPVGNEVSPAEQGEVTGDVPATPVQAWFHHLALPHAEQWNLPLRLVVRQPVPTDLLAGALAALVAHHDLLRLRVDDGRQSIVAVSGHAPVPVTEVDLSDAGDRVDAAVDRLARELPAGLDLADGPLLRAALFHTPAGQPDQLLLVAHHLVVDTVSWRILLEDLDTACRQLTAGDPVALPPKTTDFARWARQLHTLAGSDRVATDARWWLDRLPPQPPQLPVDGDPDAPNLESDAEVVVVTLDQPATAELLTPVHRAYRTRTDELLLAALVQAVAGWTGAPQLLVDVEGHGRDIPVDSDVSRTVGWFTTLTPVWLDLSDMDPVSPGVAVKAVKEQLRAMPSGGAFGLARWLRDDDLARRLAQLPPSQLSFNYLGRLDQAIPAGAGFAPAPGMVAGARHPANPRPYLIDVVAGVRDGRLELYLSYSTRLHSPATVDRLAGACLAALRGIIDHCRSPEAGGPTPSDFLLAQVDQRQLDRLVAERGPLADLYPLTPLQRGLLFHTLANPDSGVYFEQFSIRLDGALDLTAFDQAWRALLARHPVLRAGIAWQGLRVPHLAVHEQVELPLTHHDWRALAGQPQADRLAELLTADRVAGFDLTRAPLTRLHLVRLAEQQWQLVWSHHHILLDGWSVALLIQEIFDSYEAIRAGQFRPAPPPAPFRDYLAHLANLDHSAGWAYWRRVLGGLTEPTPLGADRPAVRTGRKDADYARVQRRLPAADSDAVREFARRHRLTLDTMLHGAWALLLARRSGRDDVVFGVTSSGRPPELPGVEEMVGLFINTLPARVRVSRDQPVGAWLGGLLRDQVQTRQYEHTPLDQVRSWTSMPPDQPLFESGRGLENYPMDGSRYRTGSVTISEIRTFEQSNYALSFVVVPDDELFLQLWYDALRFTPDTADWQMSTVAALVRELATDPDATVGEVLARVPAAEAPAGPAVRDDAPLPEAVASWAARAPERLAVSDGGDRLTYHQLDQRANQVANWLRERGAGPGTRVGLALPRTVDSVVAMLGILKAGAVCAPLPAGGPAAWHPLQPSLVLVPAGTPAPSDAGRVLPFDPGSLAAQPGGPPPVSVLPATGAVVVWWPGPDGAVATELTHGELTRRVAARRDEVTSRDVVAQLAEPGSEVATWETWAALANGACLGLGRFREPVATVLTLSAPELADLLDRDPPGLAGARLLLLRGELPAPYARRLRVSHQSLQVEPAAGLEPSRLAHRLGALPTVREAVVRSTLDGRRLVAYLVPDVESLDRDDETAGRLAGRRSQQWRSLYDRTYAGHEPDDPTFDTVGWNSSYTDDPIAADAMAEWRAHTVERIRELNPARVLELGCGTGLLLFGLLAECDRYLATDFSPACLAQVRDHLATLDAATRARVTLLERPADDLTGLEPGSFDVVVLNSVVQYFPAPGYLARVLAAALRVTAPGGAVFLGDLRHHGLAEAFHVSVQLHQAADLLPTEELYARVRRSIAHEQELLVDPAYLTALTAERPEIAAVQVMPKRGRHDTELTRYRYDAVLRLAAPTPAPEEVSWYDWRRDVLSGSEIGWLLEQASGDAVGVTGVPNARVAADIEAARLLARPDAPGTAGELRLAAGKASSGMDPEDLYEIGQRHGWWVAVSLATRHADGSVNALFRRGTDRPAWPADLHVAGPDSDPSPSLAGPLTSSPLRSSLAGELERDAWQSVRDGLPEYASVTRVQVIDELPRTADGQVDESALLVVGEPGDAEDATGALPAGAVPPRTAGELRLARIWEQALRVRAVDVRSSFFDLGGDSLLAIRVIDEAARVFGRDIPVAVLLQEPTIEGMAAALRADQPPWTPLVEITPGDRGPFFCVHPAGGGVLCFAELARQLGPGQPFYALQARGVERDDPPYDDLSAMAARYLVDVQERQPTGPYLLGGYSMGGLVAYEMAQQLTAAGARVDLLVLVDTPAPDRIRDELPDEAAILIRLLDGVVPLDLAQLRELPAAQRLAHVLAEAERAQVVPPGMEPDRVQHLFEVYATHLAAARRYQPRPYAGRACLLRAAQTGMSAADYGWTGSLTGAWETIEVPGDHETVLWPPHVQRLAEVIQAQLVAAQSPARSGWG